MVRVKLDPSSLDDETLATLLGMDPEARAERVWGVVDGEHVAASRRLGVFLNALAQSRVHHRRRRYKLSKEIATAAELEYINTTPGFAKWWGAGLEPAVREREFAGVWRTPAGVPGGKATKRRRRKKS